MTGLVPPAGPKPFRRGESPIIPVFLATDIKAWMLDTGRDQLTDSAEFTFWRDLLMIAFRSLSVIPRMASSIFTPRRCMSRSR
jgi:hypothetical protein